MSGFAKNKLYGVKYNYNHIEIGEGLSYIWESPNEVPDYVPRVDSKMISGMIYNYVYNDIAECVPSDGTIDFGELVMVDITSEIFRVTKYDGKHNSIPLGFRSEAPGFVVGLNQAYENPIFIALKGMVWVKAHNLTVTKALVGKELGMYKGRFILKASFLFKLKLLNYTRLGTIIDIDALKGAVKVFV